MENLEKELKLLASWTTTLDNTVKSCVPEIKDVFLSKVPLPESCPSRASMAAMVLGGVKEKLVEVSSAVHRVYEAIWSVEKRSSDSLSAKQKVPDSNVICVCFDLSEVSEATFRNVATAIKKLGPCFRATETTYLVETLKTQ